MVSFCQAELLPRDHADAVIPQ